MVVDLKGLSNTVIAKVATFIRELGRVRFAYRSDREPSIMALFDAVCRESGRPGQPDPDSPSATQEPSPNIFDFDSSDVPAAEQEAHEVRVPRAKDEALVGVPEHSHPGESQSNGKAEAAVKQIMDMTRTIKVAFEARMKLATPLPCGHPLVAWMVQHAAWLLSKYALNAEGRTPWGLLHGREAR